MASFAIAAGVSVAVGIGTNLAINALTPAQVIDKGRLSDFAIPAQGYGATIPQCWGSLKLPGQTLWATALREERTTKSSGGGLFSPKVKTKINTYFANWATLFAYCPQRSAESLLRIWFDGKLVYDGQSTDPETIAASAEFLTNHVRFYTGAFDQPVDPLIQNSTPIQGYDYGLPHDAGARANALSALGLPTDLNHIPAHRYKCYVVFENVDITQYGNRLPTVKAEILFNSNNSLETIVTDICTQLEVANIDTSGIQNISVPGFYLNKITAAKEALKTLQQAYFFDIIKTGNSLKFLTHDTFRNVINLPLSELASHQGGQKTPAAFELPIPDPQDLPASVEISYLDQEANHEVASIVSRSQVATSNRKENYTFPIVMDAATARKLADNLLHKLYLEAIVINEVALSPKYSHLEVGDRLNITFYDELYQLQIVSLKMGANRLLKAKLKVVSAANIDNIVAPPAPVESGGFNPPTIENDIIFTQGHTTLEVMDIPLIFDSDIEGLYLSGYGGTNWREASIYIASDNINYTFIDTLSGTGTIGTLASSLDATSTEFLVQLDSGALHSISPEDLNAGINKILVGGEILQFQNRQLDGTNDKLSGLVRGLRGTENQTNNHVVGERVVLLTGSGATITALPLAEENIGQTIYLKAPSPGQTLDSAVAIPITIEGNAFKPYFPILAIATKDNPGNINISWQRRDRRDGDSTTYQNLPLSEFEEKWEIEVLNPLDDSVLRTVESFQSQRAYSNPAQIADFGNLQSTIKVKIYQISAVVGRGYHQTVTLTPTLYQPAPIVTQIIPNTISIGDKVTLKGSGLAQVTAISISGAFATSLAVLSDSEIEFYITEAATTSDVISLYDTAPPTNPIYVTSDLLNVVSNGSCFTGFVEVTANTTITDAHKGKLLLVKTDSANIIINFDYSSLTAPTNFDFHVQNDGNNEVEFLVATSNQLLAKGTRLIEQYDTASFYHQGSGDWRGIGCLQN